MFLHTKKMKAKARGGARKNSGRKPIEDPKEKVRGITIYLKGSEIEKIGGDEQVKTDAIIYLRKKVKNKTK